ncbi:MAG TPA: transketolase C-terminal domain-containing protein [Bacteriovoracaceae bacterium]|nr:transketolase C-terminal domain-containing protein [Bacteriovoracaceae bacterium]
MRDTFSETLVAATLSNPDVYLLTGDHGYALFDELRKKSPDRYLNAGIAEQNMVGVAAGMAKAGLIPVVYGLAAFVPIRVLEQIKLDICHENLRVILIGDGAGVVYSKLGVSHQSFEDMSALRGVPNIRIMSPCDKQEMKLCMEDALNYKGPTYIRMGKCDVGNIHTKKLTGVPGMHQLVEGKPGAPIILATGSMVKAAQDLIAGEFKDYGLYSVSMIKPFNEAALVKAVAGTPLVITMEEHSVYGGLGGAVAEITSTFSPKKVLRLGIEDKFSDKCGTWDYLMHEHGLDLKGLKAKIQKFGNNA